jgi:hypothetical protein
MSLLPVGSEKTLGGMITSKEGIIIRKDLDHPIPANTLKETNGIFSYNLALFGRDKSF